MQVRLGTRAPAGWTEEIVFPQAERAERVKHDPRWQYFELATARNLHYTAPKDTVAILLELANAPVAAR